MSKSELTRKRYDRLAPLYDILVAPLEVLRFASWRARLRERISGERALEVGVGTGRNIPFYPPGAAISAIDASPRMLERARRRAKRLGSTVELRTMDVQHLEFPDQHFDTVFATFVFCSVPDPVQGLRELRRVCKPTGKLCLLEHMRPDSPTRGRLFDRLNPLAVRLIGESINHRTMEHLREAGWRVVKEEHLAWDIVRWIEARP